MPNDHEHEPDLVQPDEACPKCGERHMDSLVWIDDDHVRCTTCGTRYEPLAKGGRDAS